MTDKIRNQLISWAKFCIMISIFCLDVKYLRHTMAETLSQALVVHRWRLRFCRDVGDDGRCGRGGGRCLNRLD